MSSGDIDRLPVSQLPERYNLARSAVYKRMEMLGIKPERVGNRAYVAAPQVQQMDALHIFINQGGTTAQFLEQRGINQDAEFTEEASSELTLTPQNLVGLVRAIASEIASQINPALPPADPYAYLEKLDLASRRRWQLSTAEISDLLDLAPEQFQTFDQFQDAGFVFTKAGYRRNGDLAWRVSKIPRQKAK
ncbi:MAG: hypothetical protein AAGF66_01435 [Cyanobacteria bacterium P01_H01_bin.119]